MFQKTNIWLIVFVVSSIVCSSQTFTEILGRPADSTMTISVLFDQQSDLFWEYGTATGVYPFSTVQSVAAKDIPFEYTFAGLHPNTKYFYRTQYRTSGSTSAFSSGTEHSFHTQRSKGSTFKFTIEADPHPYDKKGSHALWYIALKNQLNDNPDFLIDLGDTFGDDHNPFTITSAEIRQLHLDCRPLFGSVSHSVPLFLCIGNHEGESGYYLLQTPPNNLGIYGTLWRKLYYPNPFPNRFYSGNKTVEEFGMGLPQNYYAWEWGDALFVVLDAYRGYTVNAKPRGWEWTIGKEQYDWLKQTLENSKATFKFVFTHHTLGETRGGKITANLFEWGGYETNGTTWGFTANRPGWAMPIHQLMVKTGVNIFFQGHDHLYAKEEVDGIVYQEVPMPSDSTYIIGTRDNGDAYTDLKIDASGHIRVTVSATNTTVDYVRAWLPADETAQHTNGEIAHSYTVVPKTTGVQSGGSVPAAFALEQNYPNPFNPSTVIRYHIQESGFISLKVYNVLGVEVKRLVNDWKEAGSYEVSFLAENLSSGIYYYRLNAQGTVITKKAVLLK